MPLPEPFGPIEVPPEADEVAQAIVRQANERISYLSRMVLAAVGTARKPEDVPVSLEDLKAVVQDLDSRGKMLVRGPTTLEALRAPRAEEILTGFGARQGIAWQHLDGLRPRGGVQVLTAGDRIPVTSRYIRISAAAAITLSTTIVLADGSLPGQQVWIHNVGPSSITIPDGANTNCMGGNIALSTDELATAIWDGEDWVVAHLWDQV